MIAGGSVPLLTASPLLLMAPLQVMAPTKVYDRYPVITFDCWVNAQLQLMAGSFSQAYCTKDVAYI